MDGHFNTGILLVISCQQKVLSTFNRDRKLELALNEKLKKDDSYVWLERCLRNFSFSAPSCKHFLWFCSQGTPHKLVATAIFFAIYLKRHGPTGDVTLFIRLAATVLLLLHTSPSQRSDA